MQIATAIVVVIFVFLSGRNDGGPLLALPMQSERRIWVPVLFLYVAVPTVVIFGFNKVALGLEKLIAPAVEADGTGTSILVTLVAVLVTLALSTILNAPNSITLALIGSLAGVALGAGGEVPWHSLLRVVGLGLAAPFVAALLGYLIRAVQLRTPFGFAYRRRGRRIALRLGYFILLYAYATNDGQKVLFATSLALGVSVQQATDQKWWILASALVFTLGALDGAVNSGRFLRHGIARPNPGALVITEYAAGASVLAGSLTGAPLSMTQSISGALAGTALAVSPRDVYWGGVRRIGVTWLWTLPFAALVAYLLSLLAGWVVG